MLSKKLVVTSMGYFDLDRLVSTVVFTKGLQRKTNSEIDVLINFNIDLATLSHYVDLKGVNLQQQLTTVQKSLTVSLKDFQGDIEDIKWTKVDGEMQLQIFTAGQTKVNPDSLEVKPNTLEYEHVYAIGINNASYLQKLLEPYNIPTDLKITAINKGADEPDFAQQKFVDKNSLGYAELIWNYLQSIQANLLPHELTELLTAIYWRTNALRNSYTSAQTFKIVEGLITGGGMLHIAAHKAFQQTDFILKAQQQIVNTMSTKQKYVFGHVDAGIAPELLSNLDLQPDFNPLSNLRDHHASFILIPSENNIEVVADSHHKNVNLKRSFKRFRYRGDNVTGRFTLFTQDLNKAEEIILQALSYEPSPKPAPVSPISGTSMKTAETIVETDEIIVNKPSIERKAIPAIVATQSPKPAAVSESAMAQDEAGDDLADNILDLTNTAKTPTPNKPEIEYQQESDQVQAVVEEDIIDTNTAEVEALETVPSTQASLIPDSHLGSEPETEVEPEEDPLPAAAW